MKHKVKVVMLPTEGKSGLQLAPDGSLRFTANNTWESQHIYVTVSQDVGPIKFGDWVYSVRGFIGIFGEFEDSYEDECKKIIATTDPKLFGKYNENIKSTIYSENYRMPQLQQSFLKEFVDNPDEEWEVEYEIIGHYNNDKSRNWESRLKLNPDNTVNITSVEERMYSGKKVKVLINKTIDKWRYEKDTGTTIRNNWIKDNLK
tara:strand:- start:69399 stop:70007 length:609 start_codon:yes stop_codon:yes gene_type:complete